MGASFSEALSEWWDEKGGYYIFGIIILIIVWRLIFHRQKLNKSFSEYLRESSRPRDEKKEKGSQGEQETRWVLESMFQRPFPSKRPDILKNPVTGRNLECDMMNEELKLCVEYQGKQHFQFVNHFHTPEQFQDQQARDLLKKELLKQHGYVLIEIPYSVRGNDIYPYLKTALKQHPEYEGYYQ